MQKPNRASYSALELLDWATSQSLILTPKFQRRGVWQQAARSFFIDTILRDMPIPPVYIRLTQSPKKDKVVREVIDGQQRILTITSFMQDGFSLSENLTADWRGKKYSTLTPDQQSIIATYPFSSETFTGLSDAEVLEMFSRLNTYSVPLNKQELRNGRYFGQFKRIVYDLAYEHIQYWRINRIFTERSIARMLEVELVSELMIAMIAGPQDKKKSIDRFYAEFDESFPSRRKLVERFRLVISELTETANLAETAFHRPPLFYSLFCAVYHRRFGLPSVDLPRPKKDDAPLTSANRDRLAQAIQILTEGLEIARSKDYLQPPLTGDQEHFVNSSTLQTDNIRPRVDRLATIYGLAFS